MHIHGGKSFGKEEDNCVVSTQYGMITEHLLCALCYLATIPVQNNMQITVIKTWWTHKRKGTW